MALLEGSVSKTQVGSIVTWKLCQGTEGWTTLRVSELVVLGRGLPRSEGCWDYCPQTALWESLHWETGIKDFRAYKQPSWAQLCGVLCKQEGICLANDSKGEVRLPPGFTIGFHLEWDNGRGVVHRQRGWAWCHMLQSSPSFRKPRSNSFESGLSFPKPPPLHGSSECQPCHPRARGSTLDRSPAGCWDQK